MEFKEGYYLSNSNTYSIKHKAHIINLQIYAHYHTFVRTFTMSTYIGHTSTLMAGAVRRAAVAMLLYSGDCEADRISMYFV